MKKFIIYINSMYRPSFILLCLGLAVFSFMLILLALNLHSEILAGSSDVIYRYPKMLEKIIFPLYLLLPTSFAMDTKERSKNKS